MSKFFIIAAAASAVFAAAPAFAQDSCGGSATAGHVKVFDGAGGPPIRSVQPTTRRNGFDGPHGSATNLRDTPSSDPTAGRGHGFDGPNGSASNLRDAPRPARHIPDAKVSCRKTGGDGATAGNIPHEIRSSGVLKPLAGQQSSDDGATGGITKVGAGTLRASEPGTRREQARRMQSSNNLKQIGLANTED